MERISIFNYEAFYLDYLEGNLSEEDTLMLFQFFDEHPECRLDEEELVTLEAPDSMSFSGKNTLKQVDESGTIEMHNVEHFMIADAEGLLDANKKSELDAVVANSEELTATRDRYKAVYFTPDSSIVYSGKSNLKQRKTLVLWPYMSTAVAAAAVIAILMLPKDLVRIETFGAPEVTLSQQGQGTDPNTGTGEDPNTTEVLDNNDPVRTATVSQTNKKAVVDKLNKLDTRKVRPLGESAIDLNLQPVSADIYSANNNNISTSDPVFRSVNDDLAMENPIAPVTKFISEKAKTEVDFKRRKANNGKKGGFFVKIGKFEFSRNKH